MAPSTVSISQCSSCAAQLAAPAAVVVVQLCTASSSRSSSPSVPVTLQGGINPRSVGPYVWPTQYWVLPAFSLRGGPFFPGREAPCSGVDGDRVSKLQQSLRKSELSVFRHSGERGGREHGDLAGNDDVEWRGDVQNAGAPASGKAPRAHRSRPPP